MESYTVVIPAYNEQDAIGRTVEELWALFKSLGRDFEVVVVDDGSSDQTGAAALSAGARVLFNPINSGYGFSLKRAIMEARHSNIIIIDADATYPINEIPRLMAVYEKGYDMVVGQRTGTEYRKGTFKYPARMVFTLIAEFAAGRRVPDINSGLRIFKKKIVARYREDLCNGFSFTTTITILSMLQGFFVTYIPISYNKRIGASKIRYGRDTLRVLQIIIQAILLYNPIKIFLLVGLCELAMSLPFVLAGMIAGYVKEAFIAFEIMLVGFFLIFVLGLVADLLSKLRLHFLDEKYKA